MENQEAAKVHKDTELAYMAGFFDGEGYIGVTFTESVRNDGYAISELRTYVRIEQTRKEALELFQQYFGGSIIVKGMKYHRSQSPNCKQLYIYEASRKGMRDLLSALLPYFRQNRDRAELALKLLAIDIHLEPKREQEKWEAADALARANCNRRGGMKPNKVMLEYENRYGSKEEQEFYQSTEYQEFLAAKSRGEVEE